MRKVSFGLLLLGSLSGSSFARADGPSELQDWVGEQLELADSCTARSTPPTEGAGAWSYDRFWLRLQPQVTVGVPGVVTASVTPEIELLWEREP